MILISFLGDGTVTGFKSGTKKLLERQLRDSTALVANFDTSLPLACYAYDPESNSVYLRSDWEEIKVLTEAELLTSTNELEVKRDAKALAIKEQAEALLSAPVEYTDGSLFRGGKSSGTSIQGAISLAQADGKEAFTIRHSDRSPRTTNATEALDIVLTIARAYEPIFQAEEDALYALSQIDLESDDALDQINAITLEVNNV